MNENEIEVNSVKYVRADSVVNLAKETNDMKYCVVRTYSAGVHIGYVEEFGVKQPQHIKLINSRRLHYWNGAASLSQVAIDGVDDTSRIALELPEIELTDVIEVIPCSEKAMEFFKGAKAWKK